MDSNENLIINGEENTEEVTFTKAQIISSKKYRDRKDLVNVLLKDDESYSFNEVDGLIQKFMKGKVN